jgi:hypothetical protein
MIDAFQGHAQLLNGPRRSTDDAVDGLVCRALEDSAQQ